jgi:hypothetical protein
VAWSQEGTDMKKPEMTTEEANAILASYGLSASQMVQNYLNTPREVTVREAVEYFNGKWPEKLWTGTMYFEGLLITKGEFEAARDDK